MVVLVPLIGIGYVQTDTSNRRTRPARPADFPCRAPATRAAAFSQCSHMDSAR